MAYASSTDVANRLGRPLTSDESNQVDTLLDDIEIEIKSKIEDLADKVDADADYLSIVIRVEASAVARLIRNPEGYTSETDGDYTYQLNFRLATGELEITDKEWSLLGVSSGIFLINPKVRTPFELQAQTLDPASPEYAIWAMNADMFWNPL